MATRVTSTRPGTKKRPGGGPKPPGPNGKGPGSNGHGKSHDQSPRFSAATYRITIWVVLAAVVMMFAALSSAFIILASSEMWQPIVMPRMFYLSTAIIVISSLTFEFAKRSLQSGREIVYQRWLKLTLVLGFVFLITQLLGWRELAAQGVYFQGQPRRSFFFIFTALHAVHLVGGIIALSHLMTRGRAYHDIYRVERIEASASAISLYWHTMDVLWIWLFSLLLFWG
ncbi:MAG TPA: cytochrome c oxidase subunit 3 [Pyrinomonadaceae bacterium]